MTNKKITVKEARRAIRKAFRRDPDFKRTYIDNVAMYLHDECQGLDFEVRNIRDSAAEGLIHLIFGK